MPADAPCTTTVPDTVATDTLPLLQVPPGVASLRLVLPVTQNVVVPDMAAIAAPTVTVLLTEQLPSVYTIVVVPTAAPVTTPEDDTVALAVLLLLHTPPLTELLRTSVRPTQTELPPVIGGNALTVTVVVVEQPLAEYVITVVPFVLPYTRPVEDTVATDVVLLLQVPPGTASLSCVVEPGHTVVVPKIAGRVPTVTVAVAVQPPDVYDITAVPGATPPTVPPATVATAVLLLLQVPPAVASLRCVVDDGHKAVTPVIGAGPVVVNGTFAQEEKLPEPQLVRTCA